MKGGTGWVQGYHGQVVVAEDGRILAAELTQEGSDYHQLVPMIETTRANLAAAGIRGRVRTLLADAGYWSEANLEAVEATGGPRLLIAPTAGAERKPGSTQRVARGRERMRRRLARPTAQTLYRRRGAIVEPVFGQLKEVRGVRRFRRRGFTACASEWRLICATHNLLKLWRHGRRTLTATPPPRRHTTSAGRRDSRWHR